MTALAGPFLIVCAILGLGGVAKVAAPHPARQAVRALGLNVPLSALRFLGLAEIVLAVTAAYFGGVALPATVGVAYLAFAGFVVLMLRTERGTSCGCFGRAGTPPTWLHVALNVCFAAAALSATGIDSLRTTLSDQPAGGLPLLGLVALGSYLAFLAFTALPEALSPPYSTVAEFSVTGGPSA